MQVGIFDIFLALVLMGPILVSIDATFSRNQYQGEYLYGAFYFSLVTPLFLFSKLSPTQQANYCSTH